VRRIDVEDRTNVLKETAHIARAAQTEIWLSETGSMVEQ